MKKIYLFTWIILIVLGCSSNNDLENDLDSINFTCCGTNPFEESNINNLDQSRGEIEFFGFVTPNGDSINDFWSIRNLDLYENFTLKIFDLDENLIFESNDLSFFQPDREFRDRDRVFQYELTIQDSSIFFNRGFFCSFTGTEKKSGGLCTSEFPDPILE